MICCVLGMVIPWGRLAFFAPGLGLCGDREEVGACMASRNGTLTWTPGLAVALRPVGLVPARELATRGAWLTAG